MLYSVVLFLSGISYCRASFHRGFVQNLENFGSLQPDSLKSSSCNISPKSPTSAAKFYSADTDRLQAAKQSILVGRDNLFEIPFEERKIAGLDAIKTLSSAYNFDFQPSAGKVVDETGHLFPSTPQSKTFNFAFDKISSRSLDKTSPTKLSHEEQPLLALCFDFDQTLSQTHIHNLRKNQNRGGFDIFLFCFWPDGYGAGLDYIEAFGGRERILKLGTFLDQLRMAGAAIHIVSHGHKAEILSVRPLQKKLVCKKETFIRGSKRYALRYPFAIRFRPHSRII